MAIENDQKFIEYIIKELVDAPDKVKLERTIDERGVLLTLTVDPIDMGKVIGKGGNTAKAVRTLLRVLGAKTNSRINLKINEPEGSTDGFNRVNNEDSQTTSINAEKPIEEEKPFVTVDTSDDEKTTDIV
ncbi:RNA-binding protein [Candidatus Berkelbacteria bacterium CG_4_10_14_0_8_um_filter_35_9_33_8]|uniref:RNA-binding protein KhpA n=1 Tax=Candidatus Berkelbacteria bacterium CG_4_10_14_0_2_um_filter_35_9_33_12 TaxID=1974499 RepID=A0A2M7W3M3_9BACT|nr:MAG: RNA-binding protein [Candidatus Berkelbacteria bacterium CG23_combo_of_CG06-09_8_20_14_all_33_15]PIZ27930.1 MAG: RNA-binding protein [Candidatus Berkelbacteria bacterium CG_4_10_14_0_8_um_filter_35_9_33_8]PJA20087.1 MAG: RNA-binding protein [Candidatus Berkelbacteria bacterium CG_4_10_14_0_2_um_filter_35_9_33_12]PJB51927.1 MAG: RNA-binding protein [Candidatus Berkelbacteria bacterium CG_4_9_14_3_um_filter_33_5]